jgi:hypothetical protein
MARETAEPHPVHRLNLRRNSSRQKKAKKPEDLILALQALSPGSIDQTGIPWWELLLPPT